MKMQKSALNFKGHRVTKILFEENKQFKVSDKKEIPINPSIEKRVIKLPKNDYEVQLSFTLDDEEKKLPFKLQVTISGLFSMNDEDDEFLEGNAIAILFPFLRSLIATVTVNADVPPLVLPVFNIAETLKQEKE